MTNDINNCLTAVAVKARMSWWRHQMETFSALLALCAGNSPVPVNSTHKGQWRGALMFSLICVWINDWVNNREAGDLRRYCAHYDVFVMLRLILTRYDVFIHETVVEIVVSYAAGSWAKIYNLLYNCSTVFPLNTPDWEFTKCPETPFLMPDNVSEGKNEEHN